MDIVKMIKKTIAINLMEGALKVPYIFFCIVYKILRSLISPC